jgi:hypothetical protein
MEPFDLGDGSRAALLPSGEVTGVARRFADLVGAGRATDRLVVVSPYWDDDLAALEDLRGALKPRPWTTRPLPGSRPRAMMAVSISTSL